MSNKPGLTIPELIIAITLSSVIIMSVIPLILNLFSNLTRQNIDAQNSEVATTALLAIKSDADRNYKFLTAPESANIVNPAPSTGWTFQGDGPSSRVLIMQLPATTLPYQNPSRKPVYSSCGQFGVKPVTYNTLYYLHNSNLYKRTIVDSTKPMCGTPDQKTTCLTCSGAKDILLAEGVKSFSIEYHPSHSSTDNIPYPTLASSGLGSTYAATVSIEVARPGPGGTEVSYAGSVRIGVFPSAQGAPTTPIAPTTTSEDCFTTSGTTITAYTYGVGCPVDVIIPDTIRGNTVRAINNNAFWTNSPTPYSSYAINSVVLPDTLQHIRHQSFRHTNVTDITIPASVISVEDFVFPYTATVRAPSGWWGMYGPGNPSLTYF